MNRIPPNLVYLTIYNPSLRSASSPNVDDEDAEEQAHILFYTSKEKAVSRDRMLRQIGLAKALVNFSEMFNAQNPLDTVHSQTRRMVMICPESNFWIHACIELAKVPRVVHEKGKGKKGKEEGKLKGKEREKEKDEKGKDKDVPVYDYEDSSVYDGALKEDIMRGYERFKLIHGPFTSILNTLGQEGLEVQLERFWTPWAWSWSLEDGQDFGQHLGITFHPYFKALIPTLDDLQDELEQDEFATLLLSSTSMIPSSSFLRNDYPISLPLYLASLIPPPHDSSIDTQDDDIVDHNNDGLASSQGTIKGTLVKDQITGTTSGFLNNMQALKWNWGGVLSFGRGLAKTSSRGSDVPSTAASSGKENADQRVVELSSSKSDRTDVEDGKGNSGESDPDKEGGVRSPAEGTVDLNALDDAISSQVSPAPSIEERSRKTVLSTLEEIPRLSTSEGKGEVKNDDAEEDEERTIQESEVMTPRTLSVFVRKMVYLQDGDDPLSTSQKRVYFLLRGQWMLVLVNNRTEAEESEVQRHLDHCSRKSERFFAMIEEIIQEQSMKVTTDSLPSAAKILQPGDVHIGSTGKYTFGSDNFRSKSGILHEARALQDRDPEILEVFSRGQNPQYWHMARRTRSAAHGAKTTDNGEGGSVVSGEPLEMYMEVFRKEASLSDVDNVMVGAVKTWKGEMEVG